MPVVPIDYTDMSRLLAGPMTKERFIERVPMLGSDVDSVEGDTVNVEFFPNRPDLFSVEGVARAMNTFMGFKTGMIKYDVAQPKVDVNVDPSVEQVRPFIVAGIVRGVKFSDPFIRSLMDVQEKLHASLGRMRRKVAIGIHDMSTVEQPFTYKAVDPESISFVPLGKQEEMDLDEILRKHEKGIAYASILAGKPRYPIIVDREGRVLSFPPIINGELTAVKEGTTDLFIDITGTDMKALNQALNILAAMFRDRGGALEAVNVNYKDRTLVLPDMRPWPMDVDIAYIEKVLGLGLKAEDAAALARKMGFDAEPGGNRITVHVPPYRADILHPVDIVEDLAIAFGYENLRSVMPKAMTFGTPRPIEAKLAKMREVMVGMGFLETMSLTLTNDQDQFVRMGEDIGDRAVIRNPLSEEHTVLRVSILPSLMAVLRANKHHDMPQKVFETGEVVREGRNVSMIGGLVVHNKASFTEMKSCILRLMADLGIVFELETADRPAFIDGRCAAIVVKGRIVGHMGELSPRTITAWDLEYPVAGFEFEVLPPQ